LLYDCYASNAKVNRIHPIAKRKVKKFDKNNIERPRVNNIIETTANLDSIETKS